MIRRSRFTYGVTGDFTTELSARAWTPADSSIGGRRVSGGGVPVSYLVRRDNLIDLTLRILETEWEDFLAFLQFGQTSAAFLWYPEANDVDDPDYDAFEVYLETPAMGERITPTRDGQYPRMFEVPITLRGVGAVVPWLPYFED